MRLFIFLVCASLLDQYAPEAADAIADQLWFVMLTSFAMLLAQDIREIFR